MIRKLLLLAVPVLISAAAALSTLPKIAEEIIDSEQYSVLDRANVEQVLKEVEFQVSSMVQDSDTKQAGRYLGADFVVVARVSLVDTTYFISDKRIDVESGAVVAQVSDEGKGKLAVIIQIAGRVGKKLVGALVEAAKEPPKTTTEPAKEPQ